MAPPSRGDTFIYPIDSIFKFAADDDRGHWPVTWLMSKLPLLSRTPPIGAHHPMLRIRPLPPTTHVPRRTILPSDPPSPAKAIVGQGSPYSHFLSDVLGPIEAGDHGAHPISSACPRSPHLPSPNHPASISVSFARDKSKLEVWDVRRVSWFAPSHSPELALTATQPTFANRHRWRQN